MARAESGTDELNLDELIKQAAALKKAWRLPHVEEKKTRSEVIAWQKLMDERLVKSHPWG